VGAPFPLRELAHGSPTDRMLRSLP
jgi:hypothetical protein